MNNQTIILGIDPGVHGALAILYPDNAVDVYDLPVLEVGKEKTHLELDQSALCELIRDRSSGFDCHCIIEHVNAMPGRGPAGPRTMGAQSAFNFGQTFGMLRMAVTALRIPSTLVRPAAWKKAMDLGSGKDEARAKASQMFPESAKFWSRKKDDGRAEAALIAGWGRKYLMTLGYASVVLSNGAGRSGD